MGLHEFADKRDKRKKDDTDYEYGKLFKKGKMGGALAIVILKTSRHSKMPILGRLRVIPASDPSMHLKTAGASFLL